LEQQLTQPSVESVTEELQNRLRELERRDRWLWLASILMMFLMALAIFSLSLPGLYEEGDLFYRFHIEQSARGLLGLILVFCFYTIYQQILLRRLRGQQGDNIAARIRLQIQAEVSSQLALLDPLTGVGNRRLLDQFLTTELARCKRKGYSLIGLMFDLNYFKQINDQYGHPAGDVVLKEFVNRLKKTLRSSDVVVRMGGDEFMAILPECSPEQVPSMLSRLKNLEVNYVGEKIPVSFSVGWTAYEHGEPTAQFLDRADRAVYANKRVGRTDETNVPRF